MCVVSMITDNFPKQYPEWNNDDWKTRLNRNDLIDLQKVIEVLEKIDKKLDLKNCMDAEKEKFLKTLEERIILTTPKEKEEYPG